MKQKICLKKLHGLVITTSIHDNTSLAATFAANLMPYGYLVSKSLYQALKTLFSEDLASLSQEVLTEIKALKGADVIYQPMYPNFPQQVMEASYLELFYNAISHYWTSGEWKPEYQKLPRQFAFEKTEFKELDLVTEVRFKNVFTQLLSSNDSLSEEDKSFIEWFMQRQSNLVYPETIPFKENMCVVAGMLLKTHQDFSHLIKTATDVLRLVTYLNGGDVSLAENTKFKSMPRSQRKLFAQLLVKVTTEEDINRHRSKWVKLFHNLHIGDYSPTLFKIASKIRNNQPIETFNGQVQESLNKCNLPRLLGLLVQRPGEFARKLDHLLRKFPKSECETILASFFKIANQLPTRTITQVLGHFNHRNKLMTSPEHSIVRVAFPKGNTQRATTIAPLDNRDIFYFFVEQLISGLESELKLRFSKLPSLGKVWIDPQLKECPIPSQQRSASSGLFSVARGTRLNLGSLDKNTLRFFVYWIGQDIDLSASLHDENFKLIEHISYTNLRSTKYQAAHSGDITNAPAPNGAAEFIDLTIDQAAKSGIRYAVMNVFVFRGPTFKEHEACHAGWMMRSVPKSNEIFDPKTVSQKIDIRTDAQGVIPVVFDLVERKAIWCDLAQKDRTPYWEGTWRYGTLRGNNVENNRASIEQTLRSIIEAQDKLSLYQLFKFHADVRGTIVLNKEDAQTVFSVTQDSTTNPRITPFDINLISSEYLS